MKTSTVTALAVGTGALCIVGIFGIAATADERNEAAYTATADEKIAASQKANDKNTFKTPKDEGYKSEEVVVDQMLVAELAWNMITPQERQDICNGYYLSPAMVEDIAYQILDTPEDVRNLMRIVRQEC